MSPSFPSATTEMPENLKKRADKVVVTRGAKPSAAKARELEEGRGREGLHAAFYLLVDVLERRREAEDVVSASTSL